MIWNRCNQIITTLISFHLLVVYGGGSVGNNIDSSDLIHGSNQIHIGIERKSALELNGVPVSVCLKLVNNK